MEMFLLILDKVATAYVLYEAIVILWVFLIGMLAGMLLALAVTSSRR
jgi:hypothetical protein